MKRPIFYLALFFCLGISFFHVIKTAIPHLLLLTLAFIILAFLYSKNRILSHINLYIAVFLLGISYYQNSNILPPDHISNFTNADPKKVFVKGVVIDDPLVTRTFYRSDKTTFILKTYFFKENLQWRRASGFVRADLYSEKGKIFNFGDEIVLEGLLSRPASLKNPGLFSYSKYLQIKNIYAVLKVREGFFIEKIDAGASRNYIKSIAYFLRHKIRVLLDSYLDMPYSGFLKAILIGDRTSLDDDTKEDFIKTGTVHIIAISGLHVGLIATFVLALLGMLRIPKKINLTLTLVFLIFYSFMAGSSPPVIRAVIIFSVFVIGYLVNRESDMLNSLSLAALLMLLWNPKELFDPSFQLSFLSVASIVVLTPRINSLFGISGSVKNRSILKKAASYIIKAASISIAAWVGTWPFISLYFNIISPIAIIANLVIIPMLFILTAASFLFLPAALISNLLAILFGHALCMIEKVLFFVNHYLAEVPFAYFRVGAPDLEFLILYYMLIFLLFLPRMAWLKHIKINKRALFIFLLLGFNILIWKENVSFDLSKKLLKVTFLDVGQGDSAFIEPPKGGTILIDGGSGGEEGRFDMGESVIAPYLWNKGVHKIDALVVTHFHEDHLGGVIYLLKNFKVGCVIDNGSKAADNKIYDEYIRTLKENGIDRFVVGEGDAIGPVNGVKFFILNPKKDDGLLDSNDNSIVLKLAYKDVSILFCADIMQDAMGRLSSYGHLLRSDVLKVPHHGGYLGKDEVVKSFFEKISPKVAVISVGETSRYKTPSKSTLDILSSLNSVIYQTKENGSIVIYAGGPHFAVRPFIKKN